MKVKEKLPRAKEAIRFISTHDDAPLEEVAYALDELTKFIDVEKHSAEKRRAKQEAVKAKE